MVWEGGTAQLYYVRSRWYDPQSRSFLSEDPLGLSGGRNTYAYADNDPVNGWDPTGQSMLEICYTIEWYLNDAYIGSTDVCEQASNGGAGVGKGGSGSGKSTKSSNKSSQSDTKTLKYDVCSVPNAPPGVSVDQNIESILHQPPSLLTFENRVRNHGPWDYKQQGRTYQDFGNFNYGATGTAMRLPPTVLRRMAGWAQTRAGTSKAEWGSPLGGAPYGDDPADQVQILRGIVYEIASSLGDCSSNKD